MSGKLDPRFSDTVFGFLDENYAASADSPLEEREWNVEEEEEEENSATSIEKKAFWDEQEKLLHGILCRTSSIESKARNATKEALRQIDGTRECDCRRPVAVDGSRDCLRRVIFDHLSRTGFNCSILKSKWKSSSEFPSGEHIYLEVREKSAPNKAEISVVIELNLRAEFEMARASHEYNRLVNRLPTVYVGKPERLKNLIKILCGASKTCMKEKKMHLGPWRKHKYMQAKWLSQCTKLIVATTTAIKAGPTVAITHYSDSRTKSSKASLLTLSLLAKLPRQQCQTVAVV